MLVSEQPTDRAGLRHGRRGCAVCSNNETTNSNNEPMHATERNGRDPTDMSSTRLGRSAKRKFKERDIRSVSMREEKRERQTSAERTQEQQMNIDSDTLESPLPSSAWTSLHSTANTSPALLSPRLKSPKQNTQGHRSSTSTPPAPTTDVEPFQHVDFPLPSPSPTIVPPPPTPYLSCTDARRDAYLHQSALRSTRWLSHPPPPHTFVPPITRHDLVLWHSTPGFYTIVRYGKKKPNIIGDVVDRWIWKARCKLGWADKEGWEGMEWEMLQRRLEWAREDRPTLLVTVVAGVLWVGKKAGVDLKRIGHSD